MQLSHSLGGLLAAMLLSLPVQGATMPTQDWQHTCAGRWLIGLPANAQPTLWTLWQNDRVELETRFDARNLPRRFAHATLPLWPVLPPGETVPDYYTKQNVIPVEYKTFNVPTINTRDFALPQGTLARVWDEDPDSKKTQMSPWVYIESYIPQADGKVFRYQTWNGKEGDPHYHNFLSKLGYLAANLQYRARDSVPQGNGFCIDDGFIRGNGMGPKQTREQFSLRVELPDYPSLLIKYEGYVFGRYDDDGLIARVKANRSGKGVLARFVSHLTMLRLRPLLVDGHEAEESVERINADGQKDYIFNLELRGKVEDYRQPYLGLEISTKDIGPFQTTPFESDAEALAFWDALVSQIRWREDGGPQDRRPGSYPNDLKSTVRYGKP